MEFKHDDILFETGGDGANTYRRNKCQERIDMVNKNNGSGESGPKELTYRTTSPRCFSYLHVSIQEGERLNFKIPPISTKSENSLQDCHKHCQMKNNAYYKSSSEQLLTHKDTTTVDSKSQYRAVDFKKSYQSVDDGITAQNVSYGLSGNGYYNGNECLSLSLTSLISSRHHDDVKEDTAKIIRRETFDMWLKRKEDEKRANIDKKKGALKAENKVITIEQREDLFKKWLAKKQALKEAKQIETLERAQKEKEQKKQKHFGEREKIEEWNKKKSEVLKETKVIEKELANIVQQTKEQKRREAEKAYRQWLQESKYKPLPVPLNKGKLSMRPTMSAIYVNPEPWSFDETVYSPE